MKGLGQRIKVLRKERRITLIGMSKKTGIDQATLSRIENGHMTGTLESHTKIAEALGLRLPGLYEDLVVKAEEAKDRIARKKLENFSHSGGAVAELMTTAVLQKKMMPIFLKIKPKATTEIEEYPAVTERFIYIVSGSVCVSLGEDSRELKAGETLYFNGSIPHHFTNSSKTEAHIISVMTPVSL